MIKSITIQGHKSFLDTHPIVIELDASKRVALFYGVNGAGKSAIGQVINRNGNGTAPIAKCSVATTRQDPYLYLVYNEDFVDENFRKRTDMPGIFTIGKPNASALEQAERLEKDLEAWRGNRDALAARRTEHEEWAANAKDRVLDEVWPAYTDHKGSVLKEWLEGVGNSKRKLFERLVGVQLSSQEVPPSIDDLIKRMNDVGDVSATVKSSVSVELTGFEPLEENALWQQSIVGSGDSRLSPLIDALGNIDWIGEGRAFLDHSDSKCPFCQQGLPHDFAEQLGKMFDASYEQRVGKVHTLVDDYEKKVDDLIASITDLIANEPFAKEHGRVESAWNALLLTLNKNFGEMQRKVKSPGEAVMIQSSLDGVQKLSEAISDVNERIAQFNDRILNRERERASIELDFWKRLRHDYKGVLSLYSTGKETSDAAFVEIDQELADIRPKINDGDTTLAQLRSASSGTDKAVEAINKRLLALGIETFKIKKQEGNLYHLERPGVPVDYYNSLSEGEKTLITFLYFVELINGSAEADTSIPFNRKIVVIDDPISSLSHNYVYDIASIIVHDIIKIKDDDGRELKQVIILTHSLFFYHELMETATHKVAKAWDYKRVVKDTHSEVRSMEKDELQNDYDALWMAVRDAHENRVSRPTLANAMRSILEHFFGFTRRESALVNALKAIGEDDHAFVPLGRYLNRRSHSDAINITDFGDHDENYFLDKFRKVFEVTDQMSHYNAMMRIAEPED